MARLERPQSKSSNPATMFLEYKSVEKCFEYYDKEKAQKVQINAPLKFLFLEHYHVIKGWHDPTQKGIISNEVYAISKEPLKVKTFGGLELAEGLYSNIKEKVKLSGGVYYRSIYIMLENGTIANFQLKGAVVGGVSKDFSIDKTDIEGYSDFYNKNKILLDNQWIEINTFKDAKKGATKYSIPIFEIGSHISNLDNQNAENCAKILQDYVNVYTGKTKAIIEDVLTEAHTEESDGLAF